MYCLFLIYQSGALFLYKRDVILYICIFYLITSGNLCGCCCFHIPISFRAHEYYEQKAWVCQNKCQKIHDSFSQTIELKIFTAQSIFSNMKRLIQEQIQVHIKSVSDSYAKIIGQLEKRKRQAERRMRRQLEQILIQCLPISEQMYHKMQRKQYKLISCSEVMSLFKDINIGQNKHYRHIQRIYETIKTPIAQLEATIFDEEEEYKPCPFMRNYSAYVNSLKAKEHKL